MYFIYKHRSVLPTHVQSISSGLAIESIGNELCSIQADYKMTLIIHLNKYFPACPVWLLYLCQIAKCSGITTANINSQLDYVILTIHDQAIIIPCQQTNGLHGVMTISGLSTYNALLQPHYLWLMWQWGKGIYHQVNVWSYFVN